MGEAYGGEGPLEAVGKLAAHASSSIRLSPLAHLPHGPHTQAPQHFSRPARHLASMARR